MDTYLTDLLRRAEAQTLQTEDEFDDAYYYYRWGKGGFPQNDHKAIFWINKSIKAGSLYAFWQAGLMYRYGNIVKKDLESSFYWIKKAADEGYSRAFESLAELYEEGEGVAKDDKLAFYWYKKSAESGNIYACRKTGCMYRDGKGTLQDICQAKNWFIKYATYSIDKADTSEEKFSISDDICSINGVLDFIIEKLANSATYKAAYFGDNKAQFKLAHILDYLGVYDLSFEWYQKAAEHGNADGMSALAYYYLEGRYVPEDKEEAIYWYRKAAYAGSYEAQRYLMYDEDIDRDEQILYCKMALTNPQLNEREHNPEGFKGQLRDRIKWHEQR